MRPTSRDSLVRSRLDADAQRAARYVDLQIDWVRYKSGTPVARFGGRWDRLAKRFDGDAPRSRVIEVHGAQVDAIVSFDRWLAEEFYGDRDPAQLARVRDVIEGDIAVDDDTGGLVGLSEMFLTGGRRAGKTLIMEGILTSFAIAVPDQIVWTVTPSETFHEEPRAVLAEQIMPREWWEYNGYPHYTFYLVNGSRHVMRSGHAAGQLKKGKAALVGFNEAQQLKLESYNNGRGATVDAGGITIIAANPPIEGDVGTWVLDAVPAADAGRRAGAEHHFVDPLENPHIDQRKLLALRTSMTEHQFQTQVRGRMLQLPGAVLYEWSRDRHELAPPKLGDVTERFIAAYEGDRARWTALLVWDVQSFPWIAVGIFKIYLDPRAPSDPRAGILWMVDEIAIHGADEVDVCAAIKARGVLGDRVLNITDASCEWQQMERDQLKQRPQYKGKGSNHMIRSSGFPHVVPPDRRAAANPDVFERIRATNAALKPAEGSPHLFVSTSCQNAIQSARKWKLKNGKAARGVGAAHFGDVLGYAVWRFWPRRGDADQHLADTLPPRGAAGGAPGADQATSLGAFGRPPSRG